jgi:hypothetical protein
MLPILKPEAGVDGVHVLQEGRGVKEGLKGLALQGVFRVLLQKLGEGPLLLPAL